MKGISGMKNAYIERLGATHIANYIRNPSQDCWQYTIFRNSDNYPRWAATELRSLAAARNAVWKKWQEKGAKI